MSNHQITVKRNNLEFLVGYLLHDEAILISGKPCFLGQSLSISTRSPLGRDRFWVVATRV